MFRLILFFCFQVFEPEKEDLLEQYLMKVSDIYYGLSPKGSDALRIHMLLPTAEKFPTHG